MRSSASRLRPPVWRAPQPLLTIDAALEEVVRSPARGGRSANPGRRSFLAVVHTADEIVFSATSDCREELVARLADYASSRMAEQLWAHDAARVRALLACGEPDAAVAAYFTAVGQRWDKEWLVTIATESVSV